MLEQERTTQFKKDYKLSLKQGFPIEKLKTVMMKLAQEEPLDAKFQDHKLSGNYKNHRECHIEPDWLLIYKIIDDVIIFVRTGSHSDLFQK